jgi:DNA-3-methyladenine glycosylase I
MATPLTELPPVPRQPEQYKAIFDGVESALVRVGSEKMPVEDIRRYLDEWKHYAGRELDDDGYYQILVEVIFYSGFRAATVTAKLPIIYAHFPSYKTAAAYGQEQIERILHDGSMVKNRIKVKACVESARAVSDVVAKHGSFRAYIDSFRPLESAANLEGLRRDVERRFKGLGQITSYHFLTDIGMPVLKPDRVIQRIFTRLGLVDSAATEEDFVAVGQQFVKATGHPIRYIDIAFVAYGQVQTVEVGLDHGICLKERPFCSLCGVTQYCHQFKPDSQPAGQSSH